MRQKTRLIVNSLVNVSAGIVGLGVRFVLVPFAIGILGQGPYGLWVVVGQMFAYLRILEMGLISAVAREVALHLGRGEPEEVDRYVNTAGAYYVFVGLATLVFTAVVAYFYTDWFEVEEQYCWHVRLMVVGAGLAIAYGVPQNAYAAMLGGIQRYEIVAGSAVLEHLTRLILVLILLPRVSLGWGLVVLGLSTAGTHAMGATIRTLSALRLCKYVKWRPWRGDRKLIWGMLSFGVNSVVFMMSLTVASQLAQILIAATMSPAQATDFSLAVILLTAGHSFVCTFSISTRVVASKYHGEQNEDMLRHLLLRSTRYCALVSIVGLLALTLFPEALLHLWVGSKYEGAEGLAALDRVALSLRILAITYGLFWLTLPAFNVANGMGRHKLPALVAVLAAAVSMVVVVVITMRDGVTIDRVAWGVALPMVPAWALIVPCYCCRAIKQPIWGFVWQGYVRPALSCLPAGIAAYLFNRYDSAVTWWTLGWQLVLFGAVALGSAWFFVLAPDDRRHLLLPVTRLWQRVKGA